MHLPEREAPSTFPARPCRNIGKLCHKGHILTARAPHPYDSVPFVPRDRTGKGGFTCVPLGAACRDWCVLSLLSASQWRRRCRRYRREPPPQAPGTGKPPAGSGMNTAAAFANPQCRKDAGPYGRLGLRLRGRRPRVRRGVEGGQGQRRRDLSRRHEGLDQGRRARPQRAAARGRATGTDARSNHATGETGHGHERVQGHVRGVRALRRTRPTAARSTSSSSRRPVTTRPPQRADAVTVKAKKPFAVIDGTYTSEPRLRHRARGGEDPGVREHHVARSDPEAGSVPLGPDRRQRRRDERRRVHRQAARRQEGGVRRRHGDAQPDAQVRRDLRRARHRHRTCSTRPRRSTA